MRKPYILVEGVEDGIDFDKRYTAVSWCNVACRLLGWEAEYRAEEEGDEPELVRTGDNVIAVMVGDDRRHSIDKSDLIPLEDGDYCPSCGQVGCCHGRNI
jgi:hypothetical protein